MRCLKGCCLTLFCCAQLWSIPPASAQFGPPPITNCDEYAAKARAQVEMACPHPNDPRWVRDDNKHRDFCLHTSPQIAANEDEARRNALVQGCRHAASGQIISDRDMYGFRARAEIEVAAGLGQFAPACRMVGPRWDPNLDAHRAFFDRTFAESVISNEDHERRKAVETCTPEPPQPGPVR